MRLLEVVIPCVRYLQTRSFYLSILGLRLEKEGRNHAFFTLGTARLGIVNAKDADELVRPSGHGAYLDLCVPDLDELMRELRLHGVPILDERDDAFGRAVTVQDPEGNLLNVFQEGSFDEGA